MRDVFFEELEADDAGIDAIIEKYLVGNEVEYDRYISSQGDIVVNIVADGLRQRLVFCEA
jgi:hypothetical protein